MSLFFDKPQEQTKPTKKQTAPAVIVQDQGFYEKCLLTESENEACDLLLRVKNKWPVVAFDYETTGLKPHKAGHKIICMSFSNGKVSYAFPMFESTRFITFLKSVLHNPEIKKIAHNMRMEASWTHNILGYTLKGQFWDTLIAERCIKNNSLRLSLEHLAEKYFNITGYKDETDDLLSASGDDEKEFGGNAFNRVLKIPTKSLLLRNAMDSLITFRLYEEQKGLLNDHQMKGFEFFMQGQELFQIMHENGMQIDETILAQQKVYAIKKMNRIEREIYRDPDVKKWPGQKEFKFNSPKDLGHLLFDIMGVKATKMTKGGEGGSAPKPSTDEEALSKMKLPLTDKILLWRKWQKAHGTYLAQFEREQVDGVVHSFLNLARVDTFRSSGDSPNIQNIYKREPEMKKFIRSFVKPSAGNKLIEYDYAAMEVKINACYNKDTALINYIKTGADPHKDIAAKTYIRMADDVRKTERQNTKSDFVFPTFYGSWFKNTSLNLWEDAEKETIVHLKENGIKTYTQFQKHIEQVEKWFWEKFPEAFAYKEKTLLDYDRIGHIDMYTGFRCFSPMSRNQILNYRVQGTAFHCLLWYAMQVQKEITKLKLKSKIIYEIHDSLIVDVVPEEESELDKIVKLYGTEKIREYWKWLIVPLTIEKESSEIDGNWAEMKGMGVL